MLNFKTIYSEHGTKCVINLASIDLIMYHGEINASIRLGDQTIFISLEVAAQLETWLGTA